MHSRSWRSRSCCLQSRWWRAACRPGVPSRSNLRLFYAMSRSCPAADVAGRNRRSVMSGSLDTATRFTRRRFVVMTGALAAFAFGDACRLESQPSQADDGRLTARPRASVTTSTGRERALGLDRGRDAILQLPTDATSAPLPLFVLFHGAGGSGEGVLRRIGRSADDAG